LLWRGSLIHRGSEKGVFQKKKKIGKKKEETRGRHLLDLKTSAENALGWAPQSDPKKKEGGRSEEEGLGPGLGLFMRKGGPLPKGGATTAYSKREKERGLGEDQPFRGGRQIIQSQPPPFQKRIGMSGKG